jgi:hypothetical protein
MQGVVVTQACKIFTHTSVLALLRHLAAQLQQVTAQWRRDRFFFLGAQRTLGLPILPEGAAWNDPEWAAQQAGKEIKHIVTGSRAVSPCWRAPALSAQIRVRWIPDPVRPKNTLTYLLVDFWHYALVSEDVLQQVAEVPPLVDPPREDYASWEDWQAAVRAQAQSWEVTYGEQARAQRALAQCLSTPLKKLSVRVCLDHARNPYKAIR